MKSKHNLEFENKVLQLHEAIHSTIQSYFSENLINEPDPLQEGQEAQLIFSTLRLFYENSLGAFVWAKQGVIPIEIFESERVGLLNLLTWLESGKLDSTNSAFVHIPVRTKSHE